MDHTARIIWAIRTQLILLTLLTMTLGLAALGLIPKPNDLVSYMSTWFEEWGLPAVAAMSFLENAAGLNVYFPGSIVILTAMSLTSGQPMRALLTFISIVVPAILAQNINYAVGRLASNPSPTASDNSQGWKVWLWFLTTFWHPHFAALTSLASGSSRMKYSSYIRYCLGASVVWNSFWALAMYTMGQFVKVDRNMILLLYIYILIWLVYDVRRVHRRR